MRSLLGSIVLFVVLQCSFFEPRAQKHLPFGFNPIKKSSKYIFCPFELRANLIVVKLLVDQSDTLNFVVDSGVQSIIILDSTLKYKINTRIARSILISGIGEGPSFTAKVSIGHTLRLGKIIGYNQNIVLLPNDLLNLSEFVGVPIHGIIGSDLFHRFNVRIDYARQELTFSDPEKYKYKKSKGKRFLLHLEKTKPYITENKLTVDKKSSENLSLVIDTGGTHALLLNKTNLPDNMIPKKLVDGNLGKGLNGKIEGKLGRIDKFEFAGQHFKNVIATFPDSLSLAVANKATSDELFRQGSIGGDILRRFVVTLNYRQNILVLKPNKSEIKKPFESDMSGIDLRAVGDIFKEFIIAYVIPGSVADEAGLQTGDQIISFNKKLSRFLDINHLYEQLSKKEGSQIDMIILRNHALHEVSFRLKRII